MIETQSVDVSHILAVPGISKERGKTAPLTPSWIREVRQAMVASDKPTESGAAESTRPQEISQGDSLSLLADQADDAHQRAQTEWLKTVEPIIKSKLQEWA